MPSIVKSSNMDNVMNIYEAPDPNLFVDLNCQRLRNDPNVNIITESSQIQDPNSFNAFLQSFFPNSNHIFQPQPIWATPHHHYLLQQHHLINSNDFNETSDDNFLVGNTSLQSPSDFSLDDNSPTADLSFGLVPFGTLSSLQNQSTPTDSLAIHSNNYSYAPLYYYTTSQSATLDPAHISTTLIGYPSEHEPELNPISPLNETNMLSNYSLGQDQNDSGHFFISSNQLVPPSLENFHPSPQLHQVESSLSSCPLVEIPPTAHQTLPFSPIRSGKRLRSPTLTSENTVDPNNSNYLQQSPTAYHPTLDELKFPSNSQPLLEQSLLACNLPPCPEQDTSQLKIKSSKRYRCSNVLTENSSGLVENFLTPSRCSNLLTNYQTQPVFPPTPESLEKPVNRHGFITEVDLATEDDKKKHKIKSIEKALEALDTLTDYLSKEADECSMADAEMTENQSPVSPFSPHSNHLSLVSPQHFFTLGELGGRLKRRLDVERR